MALEATAAPDERGAYPLDLHTADAAGGPLEIDWRPLVRAVVADVARGTAAATVAARFHNALADAVVAVARRLAPRLAAPRVALTGGCFQNRTLTESAASRLTAAGFEVLLHRRVPPNDGGVAFGQAVVAAARLARHGSFDLENG